jgi:hypothetical protein
MKRIALLVLCLAFMGCAASSNRIPDGKTDADWTKDEQYCIDRSGMITGFFASSPIGLVINLGGAHKRYEGCLREKGWME